MNEQKETSLSSVIFEQRDPFSSVIRLKSGRQFLGLIHPCNNNLRTVIETTEGLWYLTYNRYIHPRMTVRSEQLDLVASYQGRQNRTGKLTFSNGKIFIWDCFESRESIWGFSTHEKERIISFKITKRTPKIKGIVMKENLNQMIHESNLLLLIGCYLFLLINDDMPILQPFEDW
jgi:hypothetical protein